MSLLVKGMEMPTTCGKCPVHKLWPEDDEAQCLLKRTLWTKHSERNPDCPLVPVPPHGRLVDADEAKRKAEMLMADNLTFNIITALPTIIPAEEEET